MLAIVFVYGIPSIVPLLLFAFLHICSCSIVTTLAQQLIAEPMYCPPYSFSSFLSQPLLVVFPSQSLDWTTLIRTYIDSLDGLSTALRLGQLFFGNPGLWHVLSSVVLILPPLPFPSHPKMTSCLSLF